MQKTYFLGSSLLNKHKLLSSNCHHLPQAIALAYKSKRVRIDSNASFIYHLFKQ